MSDDEYARLQNAIAINPQAGSVIPGSGGVRKLRWSLRGRGKRGGIRVIYFLALATRPSVDADDVCEEHSR